MRYKVAPRVRSLDFLRRARGAVPLVPDDEADCCRAIRRGTDVTDRETARTYLTFLRALELVAETPRGYHRTRTAFDTDRLARGYRERVFLVAELLDAVETEPRTVDEAFEAVRSAVPRWERERHPDWTAVWRTRVERLLGWAVVFELVTEDGGRYRLAQ